MVLQSWQLISFSFFRSPWSQYRQASLSLSDSRSRDFNFPALVRCFRPDSLRSVLVSSRGLSGLPPLLFLLLRAAGTWSAGSKIFLAR